MELKANERLSVRGLAQIKRFFTKLSSLWSVGNAKCKIKIGKCFRCIVHGGKDPAVLRSLQKRYVPDGFRQRVTDTGFLIKCLRESGAVENVVHEFIEICDLLNYGTGTSTDETKTNDQNKLAATIASEEEEGGFVNEYDDPEFYGVPKSFLNRNKVSSEPVVKFEEPMAVSTEQISSEQQEESTNEENKDGEFSKETADATTAETEDVPIAAAVEETVDTTTENQEENVTSTDKAAEETNKSILSEGEQLEVEAIPVEPVEILPENEPEILPMKSEFEPAAVDTFEVAQAIESENSFQDEMLSPSMKQKKTASTQELDNSPATLRELSQILLDLCLDFSIDIPCAILMCEHGLCDGAIILIEKDFQLDPRDPRIAHIIELIWNVLEPFLEQFKTQNISSDEIQQYLNNISDKIIDFSRAVDVMQSIIFYTMHSGFRQADKELRNEVLIILTMLAQFPCAISYFLQSGLFHLLLTYACIEEAGAESWDGFCKNIGKYRNFATISDIDLEFKKELWFVLGELLRSNNPDALSIFSSSPLQTVLLQYMEYDSFDTNKRHEHNNNTITAINGNVNGGGNNTNTEGGFNLSISMNASRDDSMISRSLIDDNNHNNNNNTNNNKSHKPHRLTASMVTNSKLLSSSKTNFITKKPFISQLPLSKLREFQLLAISFLLHNSTKVLHSFELLDGPIRLISLILQYCHSDITEHKTLIFYNLILLQKSLLQSIILRNFMENNNLIQSFMYVYHKIDKIETKSQLLRLISTLCSNNNKSMQFLFKDIHGIHDLVEYLLLYVNKRPPLVGTKAGIKMTIKGTAEIPNPYENLYGGEINILVIAILDCLLHSIVGNITNEHLFAEMEGLDVILELLETSPFILRLQILRFLSDILYNNKELIIYINSWRSSKTLRSAGQILCHCWLDEEARVVGEKRDNGIITDLSHPLGKQQQTTSTNNNNNTTNNNNSTTNTTMNSPSNLNNNNNSPINKDENFDFPSPRDSQASSSIGNYFQELSNTTTNSITVSKLANAILASRNATQTNLPIDICTSALERDSRVLIASILDSLGIFEMYGIQQDEQQLQQQQQQQQQYDSNNKEILNNYDINASGYDYNTSQVSVQEEDFNEMSPALSPSSPKQVNFHGTLQENTLGGREIQQNSSILLGHSESKTIEAAMATLHPVNNILGLTPTDQQVLSMAKLYSALREAEWWQAVQQSAVEADILPIEADLALIETRLEYSRNAAAAVQSEQLSFYSDNERIKKETEVEFIDQIITKKNQQIKAEWLKKNGTKLVTRGPTKVTKKMMV